MYTRKKKAQYQNMLIRIKALQLKEIEEIYGKVQEHCPYSSWREALRIGAIS